jgi:hypothetical protein
MTEIYDINNAECSLWVTIKTDRICQFRVIAEDLKPNSKYADRVIKVDKNRTIFLSFPVSPKKIKITVECLGDKSLVQFTAKIEKRDLVTYDIDEGNNTREFLDLAIPFAQVCGFEAAQPTGRIYQSPDKKFNIKYFPVIKDYMSGKFMNTPARIGHKTGIIEVAASKFSTYTIPMRMMILLHEFSHKYKNPEMNVPISSETGADINALYIYLGIGFSKVDAIFVYANVFFKAQTPQNIVRMRKIMNYIQKFENQDFARKI